MLCVLLESAAILRLAGLTPLIIVIQIVLAVLLDAWRQTVGTIADTIIALVLILMRGTATRQRRSCTQGQNHRHDICSLLEKLAS